MNTVVRLLLKGFCIAFVLIILGCIVCMFVYTFTATFLTIFYTAGILSVLFLLGIVAEGLFWK